MGSLAPSDQLKEIQSLKTAQAFHDLQPKESQVRDFSEAQDAQARDAADHEYSPGSYVAAIYDGRG